ncbi:MAG: hypothetical protein A2798_03750 [Candidatus Levybacteria bacterium RIFCSPHIGHO2_01_FULL_37_17]|nr:MAG: hypothetical protein A2798_03750 [Candidatus Levybacteria bacterium RIFCSPHIGHO2_01_FULL_37_17]OGH36587.1 MAG: hypothetical protein A2959_03805 [Candidatus Levybacteria bacterium RIFCSPLOWO2_01_FULL_38_23]
MAGIRFFLLKFLIIVIILMLFSAHTNKSYANSTVNFTLAILPAPKIYHIFSIKPNFLISKAAYESGQINFKTEAKNPIMHLTVGKMSFGTDKLSENIEAMISAVKKDNIVSIILKSTMSPGIKIGA